MNATLSDDQLAAKAILETSRRKLTGAEEALCEDVASGAFEDMEDALDARRASSFAGDDDDDDDGPDDGNEAAADVGMDRNRFESLKIQFSREIAEWKDGVRA